MKKLLASAAALTMISASDAHAQAVTQSAPPDPVKIYYACYIPAVGTVYRIREPGLPADCLFKNNEKHEHIMFSWGAEGPVGPAGAKGDKGDPGTPGIAGVKGDKGDAGIAGAAGANGAAGSQGPKGDKGEQGDAGVAGTAGAKGDQGERGDAGVAGTAGAKGDKGDKGDAGAPGTAGAKGDKGDRGSTGPAGPKGDKGDRGESGASGSYLRLHDSGPLEDHVARTTRAFCDLGDRLTGGGFTTDAPSTASDIIIIRNGPYDHRIWELTIMNRSGRPIVPVVYAFCISAD